jgi:ectoine hydroxylase-related dioxygenase (phytanoyl-CoA dioxygenase family)
VRLYHDQALFKEPGGGYTPWHQDAMYWPLDGAQCLTMWMPLVDITPAHGGLAFATGSHVDGPLSDIGISDASEEHFDHLVAERGLVVDEPVAMRAGDASFHAGWTVHKALGNSSAQMREVMTVIWFAEGLTVLEPANSAQANDLATWLPGLAPGGVAASPANPALGRAASPSV